VKIVADANVLFAALLKDGFTRKLLLSPELAVYAPEFIAREFAAKRPELQAKYLGKPEELSRLLAVLLSNIRLIPDSALAPYLPAAASLSNDNKDWLYIAAALESGADLWSNDKGFQGQRRVRVWTTSQLAKELTKKD
jgi:predicted nucleic acid-binding protein